MIVGLVLARSSTISPQGRWDRLKLFFGLYDGIGVVLDLLDLDNARHRNDSDTFTAGLLLALLVTML